VSIFSPTSSMSITPHVSTLSDAVLHSRSTHDISDLSDAELLDRCERYGREALVWRNRFRALLPEVERRRLYLRKGFSSIYVFGKILAGLSEAQVDESLSLSPRLHDKPALRSLLESGEVSVNKITRVMSLATSENEEELAEKVRVMSVDALKTFVRDVKIEMRQESDKAEFLDVQKPESNSMFEQESEFGFSPEVVSKLRALKMKGIDINTALLEFLQEREAYIEQEKDDIAEELALQGGSGRYVPKRVKDIVREEYGTKCAKEGCLKKSEQLHHTARYGLTKSHDPHFLAPLCKAHHEIAHALDVRKVECGMVMRL